jgi:hypothetical protein
VKNLVVYSSLLVPLMQIHERFMIDWTYIRMWIGSDCLLFGNVDEPPCSELVAIMVYLKKSK